MQKLSLNKLMLKDDEMLQRELLKTVFGGSGGGSGGCPDDAPIACKCKESSVTNCKESDSDCTHTCKDLGGVE